MSPESAGWGRSRARRAIDGLHGSAADGRNLTTHVTRSYLETLDMTQSPNCPQPRLCCVMAAVTVAFVLLSPSMAGAAGLSVTAGRPIEVPWLNGFQSPTTIAVLEDGSFAIATIDTFLVSDTQVATAAAAQFFRPNGAPKTQPEILVRPPAVVASFGIGSVGDRYFVVLGGAKRTYARFYSEEGTPTGSSIRWPNADFEYFGSAPLWRLLSLTHHVTGYDQDNIPLYTVFAQVADANGLLRGVPVELPVPASELPVQDAAINGTGRFVVIEQPCTPMCTVGMQIFDSAVHPLTPLLSAGVPQSEEPGGVLNSDALTAINDQGQILLVWVTRPDDSSGDKVVARLFGEAGAPASEVIQLTTPVYGEGLAQPIALGDGSFLVSWQVQSPSLRTTVFMTRIDPSTMTAGEPTVLAAGDLGNWVVSVNGSGRGVFVWQTLFPDGAPNGAFLRTISVRP
jgi:hypothetical protein